MDDKLRKDLYIALKAWVTSTLARLDDIMFMQPAYAQYELEGEEDVQWALGLAFESIGAAEDLFNDLGDALDEAMESL